MDNKLQEIKDEITQLGTRMSNVEGYFNDFSTTLSNHMTDYKLQQQDTYQKVTNLAGKLNWGFWVIFGLLTIVLTGYIVGFVTLLNYYLRVVGG